MQYFKSNLPPVEEEKSEQTIREELEQEQLETQLRVGSGFRFLAFVWETIKVVIIALAIIIPIRYFLVQPFFVKGASMENTFQDNNYILIDEISYRFHDPVRGNIIVFRNPNNLQEFFIKRVIGLPGETVDIKDNIVTVYNKQHPEGVVLDEPYLSAGQETRGTIHKKLDDNDYFVLGDNRLHSSDSRYWGPVNRSLITGRVFYRAWPLSEAGSFAKPTYSI